MRDLNRELDDAHVRINGADATTSTLDSGFSCTCLRRYGVTGLRKHGTTGFVPLRGKRRYVNPAPPLTARDATTRARNSVFGVVVPANAPNDSLRVCGVRLCDTSCGCIAQPDKSDASDAVEANVALIHRIGNLSERDWLTHRITWGGRLVDAKCGTERAIYRGFFFRVWMPPRWFCNQVCAPARIISSHAILSRNWIF